MAEALGVKHTPLWPIFALTIKSGSEIGKCTTIRRENGLLELDPWAEATG
jgi:hypothetical protein